MDKSRDTTFLDVPSPSTAVDVVIAVVLGLIAVSATVPVATLCLSELIGRGAMFTMQPDFWVLIGWNLLILGCPVARTLWVWWRLAYRPTDSRSPLWRVYWNAQLIVLYPLFVCIATVFVWLAIATIVSLCC